MPKYPSYENVKRARRLSGPSRHKEDTIATFASSLVRDFLIRNKFLDTLKSFEAERSKQNRKTKYSDDTEAWYQASRAINLPAMCKYTQDPKVGGKKDDTAIEVCLRYLIDRREGGVDAEKREYEYFHDGFGSALQFKVKGLPKENMKHKKKPSKEKLTNTLEEALALGKETDLELYNLSLGVQLHPERFRSSTLGYVKPKKSRRKRHSPTSISPVYSQGDEGSPSSRVRSKSPVSINARDRSLSPQPSIASSASKLPSLKEQARRRVAKMNRGFSNQHWMPMKQRMKMAHRDLKVAKTNIDSQKRWESILSNRQEIVVPGSEKEMQRAKEVDKVKGKRSMECALCAQPYHLLNLPMQISYKAIIDVRESWGVDIPPNPLLAKVPRCYDMVRVCTFCSQFFQNSEDYRPIVHVDIDRNSLETLSAELEKLDPKHETSFFRRVTLSHNAHVHASQVPLLLRQDTVLRNDGMGRNSVGIFHSIPDRKGKSFKLRKKKSAKNKQ